MSRYSCKNFELKLKSRVFVGFTVLVVNFTAFVLGCVKLMDCLKSPYNSDPVTSMGGVSAICCAVVIFPIWYRYYKDLKGKAELVSVKGRIISYNDGVVLLETKDGLDTFMINREVKKNVKINEGYTMNVLRSRNGGLIKEITVEN